MEVNTLLAYENINCWMYIEGLGTEGAQVFTELWKGRKSLYSRTA